MRLLVLYWQGVVRVNSFVVFLIFLLGTEWSFYNQLPVDYNVRYRFFIYGLYYIEVCSFYTQFVKDFYHEKRILYFLSCSFSIYWNDHVLLSFILLIWCTEFIMLVIVYLDFLFLPDSVLVGCIILEMYPFFLGYVICQHIIFHVNIIILCIFVILVVVSNFTSFTSKILLTLLTNFTSF